MAILYMDNVLNPCIIIVRYILMAEWFHQKIPLVFHQLPPLLFLAFVCQALDFLVTEASE